MKSAVLVSPTGTGRRWRHWSEGEDDSLAFSLHIDHAHTHTRTREENHSYFKMLSFVFYYWDKQVFQMRPGINSGFYLTPGGNGSILMMTYLNKGETKKKAIITWKRQQTFQSLLWNNTAGSSMQIPEETTCIHPTFYSSMHPILPSIHSSIQLLQLLSAAVPSLTCLKVQLGKPVILEFVGRRTKLYSKPLKS